MNIVKIGDLDWQKGEGLIPVVVQNFKDFEVLTVAYINKEALEKTLETSYAHYYRRSYGKVMKKGLTSGNIQRIVDILVDCDQDAVLYLVEQTGPSCHLGERTCFHKKLINSI